MTCRLSGIEFRCKIGQRASYVLLIIFLINLRKAIVNEVYLDLRAFHFIENVLKLKVFMQNVLTVQSIESIAGLHHNVIDEPHPILAELEIGKSSALKILADKVDMIANMPKVHHMREIGMIDLSDMVHILSREVFIQLFRG